jgi:hypothetical protein
MKTIEKRKMQRKSRSFASIEERDRFIAESFPGLAPAKKAGYFVTASGGKLSVWNEKVIWSEPLSASTQKVS